MSVLVADVAGSTAIAERLGPERSKYLFDEVVRLMRQEVERLGGTVAQLTGDGVLAFFGAPTAHEDDTERAVRAALAIHEALGRYDADVGPAYGIELQGRVAVNTGPVVVPAGDEPPEQLYNALGDTVNVAARLQAAATLGGVCVGETTGRQVADVFELEPFGPLELKGKSAPVPAFVVAGVRETEPARVRSSLVGRDDELAALDETFSELLEGGGAVVSITGEPGIGKSRLVAEAKERYGERIHFLAGQALAQAEDSPYWPLRGLLRDWLGLGVSDPEARARLELRAGLARTLGSEADDVYPFLATLLGLPLEPEPAQRIQELSRDSVQLQTVDGLFRLVCALARERPLCLVLEDLHWADEATQGALEELLPATEDEAIAVVLVHRSDPEHEAWSVVDRSRRRYRNRFRELELEPLAPTEAIALAESEAGARLPDALAGLLADRSGGNPFFLEEALRDLFERGALRREDGRIELAAGVDELAVPALVQEALQARLDRLAAETREVLAVAAVIGGSFGLPLLERLLPRERLARALSELQWLELVTEERRQPAREYRFRHGLVQEVAYASLVEARRRELHLRVGEALEELHRESPEEAYGPLARHFAEADEPERAVDYLLKTGDAARALFAEEEALEHYRRALEFLDRLEDHQRARETLFKVALTHHLGFDFERASRAYEEAFERPPPAPRRLEPTESVELAADRPDALVPGHTYATSGALFVDHLFRGLLRVDRELNVVPELAQTLTVSSDGRTYRFRLRDDAVWSDGVPVSAGDFDYAWTRIREQGAPTAFLLEDVEGTEALDDRTLEVRLAEPRSYFPYLLGMPWFFPWPRHRYEELGEAWRRPENLVGNGPYVLGEYDDRHALLVASNRWPGARSNIREVQFVFDIRSADVAAAAWHGGRFDIRFSGRLEDVLSANGVGVTPTFGTTYVGFRADEGPFQSELVRRAFSHAVDRERLSAALETINEPATRGGLIPPAMPGHSHRVAPEYDLALARRLLAEAGYPEGRGLPEIEFVTGSWDRREGSLLADQWAELGARVRVRQVRLDELMDRTAGDCWAAGFLADYPDPDGFLRSFVETPIYPVYQDEMLRGLLARARSLQDQDERLRLYREVERIWIGEKAAILPLKYQRSAFLRRPWIEGFWLSPVGSSTFDQVTVRR